MKRWEISLAVGLFAMLLFCAACGVKEPAWWGAVFRPLCDGVLTSPAAGGQLVLRSRLWELITKLR